MAGPQRNTNFNSTGVTMVVATTIKITGNPTTATMLEDMIDYSAKPMLYGEKTLQESGRELYDLILRVANGEETKAEKLGDYSWTTPHGTSYNGDY